MLTGYFDASSTEIKTGVTAIAGYIGDANAWAEITNKWTRELSHWGLERFHRADLSYRLGRERGELCARAFAYLIRGSSLLSVWAAVVDQDWKAISKPAAFAARFPTRRHFCFEHVLSQLSVWCKDEARADQLHLVFDHDMERVAAERIFTHYLDDDLHPNFGLPLRWAIPGRDRMIETADLAVGELQKYWHEFAPTWKYPKMSPQLGSALGVKPLGECGLCADESLAPAITDFMATGDAFSKRSATGGLIIPV